MWKTTKRVAWIPLGVFYFILHTWLSASEMPNVVIILTDDQGWADIGFNNPKVTTPNLDELAESGAKFTRFYVTPQCTPTRVALMTGRFPGRFGPQATQANSTPAFRYARAVSSPTQPGQKDLLSKII